MIFKFKLSKYETLNSKGSHQNSMKNSTNHKNSSTTEIQKHKELRLVKAVTKRWEYEVPSACAKNLQKTVKKNIYFWSNEMAFLVEQIRMFKFRT